MHFYQLDEPTFYILTEDELNLLEEIVSGLVFEQIDTRNSMSSPLSLILLQKFVKAEWSNNELKILKANQTGMMAVAKVSAASVKDKDNPGRFLAAKRIEYRPNMYRTGIDYSHAYRQLGLYEKLNGNDLFRVAELAALYTVSLPTFEEHQDRWGSYKEYLANPDLFFADYKRLIDLESVESIYLYRALDQLGLPYSKYESSALQILEYTLGFTQRRVQHSLFEIIETAIEIKQKENGVTMAMDRPSGKQNWKQRSLAIAKEAATVGAANAVLKKTIQAGLDKAGATAPDFLKSEAGQQLLLTAVTFTFMNMLELPFVADRIPANVKAKAEYLTSKLFEKNMADASGMAVEQVIDMALPMLQEYLNLAGDLELPDTEDANVVDMSVIAAQQQREMAKSL